MSPSARCRSTGKEMSRRAALGWLAPDRDMAAALRRERVSMPVCEACFEFESCNLRHQVTLGRPDVPKAAGAVTDGAVGVAIVVVRGTFLGHQVVGVEGCVSV